MVCRNTLILIRWHIGFLNSPEIAFCRLTCLSVPRMQRKFGFVLLRFGELEQQARQVSHCDSKQQQSSQAVLTLLLRVRTTCRDVLFLAHIPSDVYRTSNTASTLLKSCLAGYILLSNNIFHVLVPPRFLPFFATLSHFHIPEQLVKLHLLWTGTTPQSRPLCFPGSLGTRKIRCMQNTFLHLYCSGTSILIGRISLPCRHRRSQEDRGSLHISSVSCHFALWEVVSQTKYCCSLKVKRYAAPKIFDLATLLPAGLCRSYWFTKRKLQTTRWRSLNSSAPVLTRTSNWSEQVSWNWKTNEWQLTQQISASGVLVKISMLEKGVHDAQCVVTAQLQ